MWDSGRTPTRVIRHGVRVPPELSYAGDLPKAISVVNNLPSRGRRTGEDVFRRVRESIPIDLAGMGSEDLGGLGDLPLNRLHSVEVRYRLFFNPIRYTSLGLAVCEAMMLGLPIVGLATTEMAVAVENGVSGYVDTDVGRLIEFMRQLLDDPVEARRLGEGARRRSQDVFGLGRFVSDWRETFEDVAGRRFDPVAVPSGRREP